MIWVVLRCPIILAAEGEPAEFPVEGLGDAEGFVDGRIEGLQEGCLGRRMSEERGIRGRVWDVIELVKVGLMMRIREVPV